MKTLQTNNQAIKDLLQGQGMLIKDHGYGIVVVYVRKIHRDYSFAIAQVTAMLKRENPDFTLTTATYILGKDTDEWNSCMLCFDEKTQN